MTDITEFLRARLDEDRAAAEAAKFNNGRWHHRSEWAGPTRVARDFGPDVADGHGTLRCDEHAHIARHDPARVLAQVAAMRAVVDLHESWPVLVETPPEMATATDDVGNMTLKMAKQVAWMTEREYRERFGDEPPTAPMLRHLAAIWRDHEAYDPAWAPEGE